MNWLPDPAQVTNVLNTDESELLLNLWEMKGSNTELEKMHNI